MVASRLAALAPFSSFEFDLPQCPQLVLIVESVLALSDFCFEVPACFGFLESLSSAILGSALFNQAPSLTGTRRDRAGRLGCVCVLVSALLQEQIR